MTGWDVTRKELHTLTRGILNIQRIALLIGGSDVKWEPEIHDDNPKRFYDPLPSWPDTGKRVDRKEVKQLMKQYFKAFGWDEKGIPTRKELKKLGLTKLIPALNNIE